MKTTRSYTMRARAEQAEQTRRRILEATIALAFEVPLASCTLPAVAERAGVSVQTILRGFGSRDGLFEAAIEHGRAEVLAERPADPDDLARSIDLLLDHYERRGDGTLLLLGQESWEPVALRVTTAGRAAHRAWVERAFTHSLDRRVPAARDDVVDLLVAATDLYTWKLWRRDRGLSRGLVREHMLQLVAAIIDQR